eukprot:13435167-Heterocapsa_arctica.AAC.1
MPFQVFVQVDNQSVTIDVDQWETILRVKGTIEDKMGILLDNYRVLFNGKQLDDNSTVGECNIVKESTLRVVGTLNGGMNEGTVVINIRTLVGQKISKIEAKMSDTVGDLKDKIQD